jgi:putative ABC transport system permease protein
VALGIDPDNLWREIVGVVGAVKHDSLEAATRGTVYVPLRQRPTTSVFAVLRTDGDPMTTVADVRAAVKRLDPDLPLYDVASLRGRVNDSVARRQITALVVGTFAALALMLALTGVYGVIAYTVSQRTREIGVRMALGAQTTQVLGMFVRSSMRTAISGILVGTVLTIPLMYAGARLLFEVVPYDPVTYLMTSTAFLLLSAVVSSLSARRATTVDPLTALRS